MSETGFFLGLIVTVAANTALFIWRLVAVRDDVLARIDTQRDHIEDKINLIKIAVDLEIDRVREELGAFKVHVAREYLDKESVVSHIDKLEATIKTGLDKLEARMIRWDQSVMRSPINPQSSNST